MKKSLRTPKNYRGIVNPEKKISDLLPIVLSSLKRKVSNDPKAILDYWKEAIGPTLFPMTEPISFHEGVLIIKVKNATLLSILVGTEKVLLLRKMRAKFSNELIRELLFRAG